MKYKHTAFLRRLLFWVVAGWIFGASSPGWTQGTSRATKYHFKFSLIALKPDQPGASTEFALRNIQFQTGSDVRTIHKIPYRLRSMQFTYRGNEPLTFFRTKVNADGKEERKVLAVIDSNSTNKDILILAIPKTSDIEDGFRTITIEDHPDRFPVNSMQLMNFTDFDLKIKLGDKEQALAKKSTILIPLHLTKPSMVPFIILGNPWARSGKVFPQPVELPLYTTTLSFSGKHRYLCLLFPNKENTPAAVQEPLLIKENPDLIRKDAPDKAKSPSEES